MSRARALPLRGRRAASLAIVVLVLGLMVSICVAVSKGPVPIPLETVVAVIARRLGLGEHPQVTTLDDQIVWQLRMPRVVGGAATGAVLAVVGAVLQSLTRNDLADPYLLGVSGGATVGAVLVLVLGFSVAGFTQSVMITLAAFVGAVVALIVVLLLATGRSGSLPPTRVILAGVAVGQICTALTSLIVMMSGQPDAARRVMAWTLGSLAGLRWGSAVFLVVVAVVGAVVVVLFATQLDAFAFGEAAAASLGVSVERLRWTLLVGMALLVACAVAFTGAIGFVGLVVPHIVRIVLGPLHRVLLPVSALAGAVLLIWADTLARTLVPGEEIPIGVITALLGAPVFAVLLRRQAVSR